MFIIRKTTGLILEWSARFAGFGSGGLGRIARNFEFIRIGLLQFVPRRDDIFIATYSRSGSTWMQMILYQLITDGRMDIPHINQFSPWFERVLSRGYMSLKELGQRDSPRVFKTHLNYRWVPKGSCKYIYVLRDGKDVAVSLFHFYRVHFRYEENFSDFFEHRFLPGKVQYGSWFRHVTQWRENKDNLDILYLRFEDMVEDLEGAVRRIIDFCGLEVNEARIPEILEKCSFQFMKRHEDKFDHVHGQIWERYLPGESFLRKGKTGEAKLVLTDEQQERFDRNASSYGIKR